jgi:hypothetical protein
LTAAPALAILEKDRQTSASEEGFEAMRQISIRAAFILPTLCIVFACNDSSGPAPLPIGAECDEAAQCGTNAVCQAIPHTSGYADQIRTVLCTTPVECPEG